jgi:cytochrome c biogenesis protein CcmG, thiol:disulfide interchange protein DsbE
VSLRSAGLVLAVLALAGCGTTASGTGTPVASAPSAGGPSGSVSPADPSLVAQAALQPCPSAAASGSAPAGSRTLPDISLPCLGAGPAVRLAGLSGTPTVVNVWASWCTECRAELALLARLASSTPGVRVIGVDAQDDPSSALSVLAQAGAHYPSVRDDSAGTKAALQWGSGLPVTLFVRADGSVAFQQHGALADQQQLTDLVSEHLGVTAGS